MNLVCDTGPIIALAKLRRLALLVNLADHVLIPTHVHRELLAKVGGEADEIEKAVRRFIQVLPAPPASGEQSATLAHLDEGERQAILLALAQTSETVLLMDDRAGRTAARQRKVAVTGVVGLLLRAKERGLIRTVTPSLRQLQRAGYWLSDETIQSARTLARE